MQSATPPSASGQANQMVATITLAESDASPERLDELALAVREELLDTEVGSVTLARGAGAPADTRAADPTMVGELVVVLGSSSALLRSVIAVLKAWRERNSPRRVEMHIGNKSIVLSDATENEQERLVDEFIRDISRR